MTLLETPGADTENDLDFRGSDTQYGTHGIHTYVAAMIPQLAERLINCYAPREGPLFDPFCGGGAVLVESVLNGRAAIGKDVNQLAVLISKAKTTPIHEIRARQVLGRILDLSRPADAFPVVDENLAYWFKPEHLAPLDSLVRAIKDCVGEDDILSPFFLTIFSATVRDVSLTYRNEVRLRKMSEEEIARFNVDPVDRFESRAERAIEAAKILDRAAQSTVSLGTAQDIDLEDDECSAIICSPPYGDERNGVSYTQFSKNMLGWIGYTPEEVKEAKGQSLGWGTETRAFPQSGTLDTALNQVVKFPDAVQAAGAFYSDYEEALREMVRVTSGPIVIVIGQRVLRDTVFDNAAITEELMANQGVELCDRLYRQLPSKRLPKMRRFGAAINQETILVFQK